MPMKSWDKSQRMSAGRKMSSKRKAKIKRNCLWKKCLGGQTCPFSVVYLLEAIGLCALCADFWSISTWRHLTFCNTHSTMQLSWSVSVSFIQAASRWIADFQFSQPAILSRFPPQSAYKYVIRCLVMPITVLTPLASLFIRNWGCASHAKGFLYPSKIGTCIDAVIVALKRKAGDVMYTQVKPGTLDATPYDAIYGYHNQTKMDSYHFLIFTSTALYWI